MELIIISCTLSLSLLGGYLIGSIPFGFLLSKIAGVGDIRKIGSGNIGATNVLRTGNKRLAALTLLLDMMKGAAAVALGWVATYFLSSGGITLSELPFIFSPLPIWESDLRGAFRMVEGMGVIIMLVIAPIVLCMALGALLGHMFPVWLKFRGGKGVATYFGALLTVNWLLGTAFALIWLTMFSLKRISSLSSIVATALIPLCSYVFFAEPESGRPLIIFSIAAAILILYRHKDNIRRLMRGEEARLEL